MLTFAAITTPTIPGAIAPVAPARGDGKATGPSFAQSLEGLALAPPTMGTKDGEAPADGATKDGGQADADPGNPLPDQSIMLPDAATLVPIPLVMPPMPALTIVDVAPTTLTTPARTPPAPLAGASSPTGAKTPPVLPGDQTGSMVEALAAAATRAAEPQAASNAIGNADGSTAGSINRTAEAIARAVVQTAPTPTTASLPAIIPVPSRFAALTRVGPATGVAPPAHPATLATLARSASPTALSLADTTVDTMAPSPAVAAARPAPIPSSQPLAEQAPTAIAGSTVTIALPAASPAVSTSGQASPPVSPLAPSAASTVPIAGGPASLAQPTSGQPPRPARAADSLPEAAPVVGAQQPVARADGPVVIAQRADPPVPSPALAVVAAAAVTPPRASAPIAALRATTIDGASAGIAAQPGSIVAPTLITRVEASAQPLDVTHEHWPVAMIERIEHLRDAFDAVDTRIRLVPDALGGIDLSVRTEGDTVHVRFNADQAATRAMLVDAQPRLAEIAEQRGLKLGQTSIDAGPGQQWTQQGHQQQPRHPSRPAPASAFAQAPVADVDADDGRIA